MVNALALFATEKPTVGFVCFLGISIVFLGLACLIGIISIMNASIARKAHRKISSEKIPEKISAQAPAASPIENREEILAAVCAAVAEENGTDVSAIRVISFKKLIK